MPTRTHYRACNLCEAMCGLRIEADGYRPYETTVTVRPDQTTSLDLVLQRDWPTVDPVQAIEPIRFAAKEFALVHSELGLARYNIIERWSLED